ncbi:hypothetical protein KY290_000290 [Solanum tuberosum]|uniref:Secreted protein n=1 Tax=Solanum tuberosum TaxID=4113 RepID=A0ABQ7WL76_SOLTU|nr:hypothetical protein KY290_000290 [Solanum tuberosum]
MIFEGPIRGLNLAFFCILVSGARGLCSQVMGDYCIMIVEGWGAITDEQCSTIAVLFLRAWSFSSQWAAFVDPNLQT